MAVYIATITTAGLAREAQARLPGGDPFSLNLIEFGTCLLYTSPSPRD